MDRLTLFGLFAVTARSSRRVALRRDRGDLGRAVRRWFVRATKRTVGRGTPTSRVHGASLLNRGGHRQSCVRVLVTQDFFESSGREAVETLGQTRP